MSPSVRGRWARWRVDLRLARRQVWRTKGSSVLVMLLVALPVMGMTGAAVFWQSHVPTAEQRATMELGRNDSWIQAVGGPDPSRWQAVDDPWSTDVERTPEGAPVNPELPSPTGPPSVVPASATVRAVHEYGSITVDTAAGVGNTPVTVGDTWDPVFAGRYVVVDGATPTRSDEAMVSPGLLERLGARIGDAVALSDAGRSFTITGTMRQLDQSPGSDMLFLPADAASLVPDSGVRWFVAGWQPDLDQLTALNHAGYTALARDLAVSPPPSASRSYQDSSAFLWQALMVGSIVAVFCGYLVVLLAGAAFAVAARRQQRSLAVAGSVGAARGDIFRIVVMQGTVLGLVGGALGAGSGILGAWLLLAATDDGVVGSFWGNWGVQVPWAIVGGILAFAVVVGTLSALAPARTATRGEVLVALRGSRRPARLRTRRPLWGLGMMVVGIAATVAGGAIIASLNLAAQIDYSSPIRALALYAIVLGPIVFQVGVLVAGHWTISLISRAISRLGLAARLAGRDAAANPSRVVPAFAAIAACVFIASFAMSMTAMTAEASNRNYSWNGPEGSVAVGMWSADASTADAYTAAARELLAPTKPASTALVQAPSGPPIDPATGTTADPAAPAWTVADRSAQDCERCDPRSRLDSGSIQVVSPDDLETILDTRLPVDALREFRDGGALVFMSGSSLVTSGTVQLVQWRAEDHQAYYDALQHYYSGELSATDLPKPADVHELPGRVVDLPRPQGLLQAVITPDTAQRLGMILAPQMMYAIYPEPADDSLVDSLTTAAQTKRVGDLVGALSITAERGPAPIAPWLWLICAAAGVLVVGAAAVCLGLARFERRADDATLAAVGAGRGIRRRVNAWQAAILVGVGTVVGTIAGLIPLWGITQSSQDYLRFADAPWASLAVLAFALPLAVTLVAWLVAPRHPELTRRTAIA